MAKKQNGAVPVKATKKVRVRDNKRVQEEMPPDFLAFGSGEGASSEPIRAVKDVLSSSKEEGLISRYSDLSESDIQRISFLETYANIVREVFDVDVGFIPEFTRRIKEHKVSKGRKGREEIVKILTAEEAAEKEQQALLKRLMGVPR